MSRLFACCTVLLLLLPTWLFAQTKLQRLDGPITLDGLSNEAAWAPITPFPLTVYQPVHRGDPTERTELRVAYDDTYLYVAGRMYDSQPEGIRVNSLYRDRFSNDDGIAVVLDTFNDNENALWFIMTAGGVRLDWAVYNDGVNPSGGGPAINRDWNTFWDLETVVNDEGWFAEARIPLSSLRFQDVNGRVEMGMIVYRYMIRKNERHIFPDISPDFSMGFSKPSLAHDVVLEGVYSQNPVYITPYASGGIGQNYALNATQTAYERTDDFARDIGLDMKYNLTSNLTLDVTLNTDFAQVEADDEQVNLTRFSLFFPEKRQFFQERASIFDFSTGRVDRLFYSRRIGLNGGQPVPIIGGARLVGRLGAWDVGLIDMQTARTATLPTENFGVVRVRRQAFNAYSTVGGILTNRVNADGASNLAYGLDTNLRLFGDDYLSLRWAQTFDSEARKAVDYSQRDASLFRIKWERRRQIGWNYQGTFKWYGAAFLPGMGFITRQNIKAYAADLAYGWFAADASRIRTGSFRLATVMTTRNTDGSVESGLISPSLNYELKNSARLSFNARWSYEDLDTPLFFPEDTTVPVGDYTLYGANARYTPGRNRQLRMGVNAGASKFYDGWRVDVGVGPTWNASKHLELALEYSLNMVRFNDRDQAFNAHIARVRMQGALNRKFSTSVFLQYSSASDLISANVRLRYNFAEGNDLWIVYNEGLNTDRDRLDPLLELPRTQNRTALLKYTYTFTL